MRTITGLLIVVFASAVLLFGQSVTGGTSGTAAGTSDSTTCAAMHDALATCDQDCTTKCGETVVTGGQGSAASVADPNADTGMTTDKKKTTREVEGTDTLNPARDSFNPAHEDPFDDIVRYQGSGG